MSDSKKEILERFEKCEINPKDFNHREHLEVAYKILEQYEFIEACLRYSRTIKTMVAMAGVPEKSNVTITTAFLSVVAERRAISSTSNFQLFLEQNPELLDKQLLERWYTRARLYSKDARTHFLLPDKSQPNGW